jgi:organic radical activating enzyme
MQSYKLKPEADPIGSEDCAWPCLQQGSAVRTYQVKEIFGPTLQGEGLHAGWPCTFLRLSGCNAWDGRPETRSQSSCPYCDTDFRGGDRITLAEILTRLTALIDPTKSNQSHQIGCVLTGGEPLLQADAELVKALAATFAWVDIETNGTRSAPYHGDNVFYSCSPKKIAQQPVVIQPDWWKILLPDQRGFLNDALLSGKPVYVQPTCPDEGPMADGPAAEHYERALKECQDACYAFGCRLSLQTHKYLGIE